MSLTLLLDLDDTLLVNDIEAFLPNYLGAFSRQVAAYLDPDLFVRALLAGTREMVRNRRPDCTLQEVFEAVFYSLVNVERAEFQAVAERFYAEVFPTLQSLTSVRPQAVQLVEQAIERGYRLVIATNPLFPMTAILQRLAWANLSADKYPYALVTSYEAFHYTKPDPAYFAEIMARLGWPAQPVVMVGDDLERDISASRQSGLPAFWVSQDGSESLAGPNAPNKNGDLGEVLFWIDGASTDALQPDFSSPSAMLATLRATPAALDSICRELLSEDWSRRPEPSEWCLTEILCHLRDVEQEVNLPRIQKMVQENNPFLPGQDTDPWAETRGYIRQDGRQAFARFIAARLRLVEILEALSLIEWERPARHAIFGPTQLAELVGIIAGHDRLHLQQVQAVLQTISP